MSKPVRTALLLILGLVTLAAAGSTIVRLVQALVPLVLVLGIVATELYLVRYYTRR